MSLHNVVSSHHTYAAHIIPRQGSTLTALIFLSSAGVELEEGGEKWRAGDAAKSMRFFMRAIANYDEGLRKQPRSFDLAYNKCVIDFLFLERLCRLVCRMKQWPDSN